MASIYRWITAPDKRPPSPPPSTSHGGRHNSSRPPADATTLTTRRKGSNDLVSRHSPHPDSVTYASKDAPRGVQFICRLPPGSPLAAQAQQIAGAVYSGRPVGGIQRGLGGREQGMLLQDAEAAASARSQGQRSVVGGAGGGAGGARSSKESVVEVIEESDDDDDERGGDTPASRRRAEKKTVRSRHAPEEPSPAAAAAAAAAAAVQVTGGGSLVGGRDAASKQQAAFRHQSDTHITYTIKNKDSGRHLFVSAPVGSDEALMHEQVAEKAAGRAATANNDGERGNVVVRRR